MWDLPHCIAVHPISHAFTRPLPVLFNVAVAHGCLRNFYSNKVAYGVPAEREDWLERDGMSSVSSARSIYAFILARINDTWSAR